MKRKVVIDPERAAHVPADFADRARVVLERLPEAWDTVACVADFTSGSRKGRQKWADSGGDEYTGPRWVFIADGAVETDSAGFEQMERRWRA